MQEGMTPLAGAGRALLALLFGKLPDNDWGSALISVLFGGSAGALVLLARH